MKVGREIFSIHENISLHPLYPPVFAEQSINANVESFSTSTVILDTSAAPDDPVAASEKMVLPE